MFGFSVSLLTLIFFESFLKTSCSKNLQASCGRQAYALTTKALLVAVGEEVWSRF